jgi:hypothetical protein
MQDFSGIFWSLATIGGPIILAVVLALAGYRTIQRRRRLGLPVGARPASPGQAAYVAATERRSPGTYMLRLGLPVLATCVLIAVVIALYTGQ